MPVIRIEKAANYTVISNYPLRDSRLSLKACALLCKMLCNTDTWDYSITGMAAMCKDGKSAVSSAMKELEQYGYRERCIRRDRRKYGTGFRYADSRSGKPARSIGTRRTARFVDSVVPRRLLHEGTQHLYFYHHLRQNDRNIFSDLRRADSDGNDDEPGKRTHGTELSEIPRCARPAGVPYHHLCGDLRGTGAYDFRDERHFCRPLDLYGVHGSAVLLAVQDGKPRKVHYWGALKNRAEFPPLCRSFMRSVFCMRHHFSQADTGNTDSC